MTEIYLIRHGEAEGNVFRRLHGQYNSLLMPRGYTQCRYLQERFDRIPIDAVYSSDLTRACLTARSIYIPKGLKLHLDSRFRELDVGSWEDMAYGYLDNFHAEKMRQFSHDPKNWFVEGSERYENYTDRFITAMAEAAQANEGGTIAIFSHGAVLRGTLMRLFFADEPDKLPLSDNAGVSRLFYDNGTFTYDYLNDNSHIPEELSTFYLQSWWRKTDNRRKANLYFIPWQEEKALPHGLRLPGGEGELYAGILMGNPVGLVCLGNPQGSEGVVCGISLQKGMEGRGYADQLLGCAFSYFRRKGCKSLRLAPGDYPENVHIRYGFDPVTLTRSIDADAFSW